MLKVYGRKPVLPLASVAVMVKLDEPGVVGVPLSRPPDARLSPAGNDPDVTAKLYGALPPTAVMVWL